MLSNLCENIDVNFAIKIYLIPVMFLLTTYFVSPPLELRAIVLISGYVIKWHVMSTERERERERERLVNLAVLFCLILLSLYVACDKCGIDYSYFLGL